jgi:hypothetical protein
MRAKNKKKHCPTHYMKINMIKANTMDNIILRTRMLLKTDPETPRYADTWHLKDKKFRGASAEMRITSIFQAWPVKTKCSGHAGGCLRHA